LFRESAEIIFRRGRHNSAPADETIEDDSGPKKLNLFSLRNDAKTKRRETSSTKTESASISSFIFNQIARCRVDVVTCRNGRKVSPRCICCAKSSLKNVDLRRLQHPNFALLESSQRFALLPSLLENPTGVMYSCARELCENDFEKSSTLRPTQIRNELDDRRRFCCRSISAIICRKTECIPPCKQASRRASSFFNLGGAGVSRLRGRTLYEISFPLFSRSVLIDEVRTMTKY
jgi:hypothetical protein